MTRLSRLTLTVFFLLITACAGDEPPTRQEVARPAKIFTVKAPGTEHMRSFPGEVQATDEAELAFRVSGELVEMLATRGSQVKQGDLLARLDAADFQAAADQAQAEYDLAKSQFQRTAELVKRKLVSQAEHDQKNAVMRVRQSGLTRAENNLDYTRLIAPFDGIVAEINGELNEYTTPSPPGIPTPPAVDLIDNSCFYVAAPIDEVDAPKVKVAQPARVNLDAFDEQRFPGVVRRVAAYVLDKEKQARTVEIEVEFSNKKDIEQLLAGYSADVEIILDVRERTLRIPTEAVLEGDRVFVFDASGGVLQERKIETGISNWDHTEILKGIEAGELIVTSVDRDGVEDGALARQETDGE